ncbi:NADPH-dependent FMN reductase [Oceanisphaera avium]|uniref:NADPH-dependent oxidoreductase n=1 Tax=Oceanisphaera avium TaxID=1903694 RepID=A0A1Y0CY48_9GAMM|nr:NAD(P)H-dependent oxidoreductase [Oceanisphaera avium]ART80178.1 NADPH-dependent oxidoreductase [Oceanisphaera avium]
MALNLLIFLGSVRTSGPPFPARLGERVALYSAQQLTAAGHKVTVIDPLDYPLGEQFKPHFAYSADKAPPALQQLSERIKNADGYVMVSPEYNHSMSPALAHLLNHFGSSLFSYKPCAIVTYSAGQWGGVRAAVNMRSFLSELGCLPVSAMIHVPHAQLILNANGAYLEGVNEEQWQSYFARTFSQLTWWANATKEYARRSDGQSKPSAFTSHPAQRNAPSQD